MGRTGRIQGKDTPATQRIAWELASCRRGLRIALGDLELAGAGLIKKDKASAAVGAIPWLQGLPLPYPSFPWDTLGDQEDRGAGPHLPPQSWRGLGKP